MKTDKKDFQKVDYQVYKGKYNEDTCVHLLEHPDEACIEDLREQMYGYTYTQDYARGIYPDALSMDYWSEDYMVRMDFDNDDFEIELNDESDVDDYIVDTPQERMLLQTIESTGDGLTPETAFCIIDVSQEYEFMDRVFPYNLLTVSRQRLLSKSIDCIEFIPNTFNIERIYFDVSRRLDVGYVKSENV